MFDYYRRWQKFIREGRDFKDWKEVEEYFGLKTDSRLSMFVFTATAFLITILTIFKLVIDVILCIPKSIIQVIKECKKEHQARAIIKKIQKEGMDNKKYSSYEREYNKIAQDENIDSSKLMELMKKPKIKKCKNTLCFIALNPKTPIELLSKLSKSKLPDVRKSVARNKNTAQKDLKRLSKDKITLVRRFVFENPSTPKDVTKVLSEDERVQNCKYQISYVFGGN